MENSYVNYSTQNQSCSQRASRMNAQLQEREQGITERGKGNGERGISKIGNL